MKSKIGFSIIASIFIIATTVVLQTCDLSSQIPVDEYERINTNINSLAKLSQPEEKYEPCNADCTGCMEHAGFDSSLCMDPDNPAIWPGSLVDGAGVPAGTYSLINAARTPLRLRVHYNNGDQLLTVNPSLIPVPSSYMKDYVWNTCVMPACANEYYDSYMEILDVYSLDQLKIALKTHLGYDSPGTGCNLDNIFDFTTRKVWKLMKLIYIFYEVQLEQYPRQPSDMFDLAKTKWDDLDGQIGTSIVDNANVKISPVYVTKVEYGTMGLFFIEMNDNTDSELLIKALDSISDEAPPANQTLLNQYANVIATSVKKALIFGNSTFCRTNTQTQTQLSYDTMLNYVQLLKNPMSLEECNPLVYGLRYLNETDPGTSVSVVLTASYDKSSCDYNVKVVSVDENGCSSTVTHAVKRTDPNASFQISSAASYTSHKVPYTFLKWEIASPAATIANSANPTTKVSLVKGDCVITAVYKSNSTPTPTPAPTAVPTAEPTAGPTAGPTDPPTPEPKFILTYNHYLPGNVRHTQVVPDCTYNTVVPITTEQTYNATDYIGNATYSFTNWSLTNPSCASVSGGLNATVTNFTCSVTVDANYEQEPPFTIIKANNCNSEQATYTVSVKGGTAFISTESSISMYPAPTMYFCSWSLEYGLATLEGEKSTSMTLSNVRSHIKVRANYAPSCP